MRYFISETNWGASDNLERWKPNPANYPPSPFMAHPEREVIVAYPGGRRYDWGSTWTNGWMRYTEISEEEAFRIAGKSEYYTTPIVNQSNVLYFATEEAARGLLGAQRFDVALDRGASNAYDDI